jgi:anaerobic selenocysteine-containing dehydrogenase
MTLADVRVHTTVCTLDCPDACSLSVTVTDGRITDIDAAPDNPHTQGWICAKVKRHAERVYAPERVLTPLVRIGPKGSGEFRPCSWDEALDLVAARIRATIDSVGPDGVVGFTYNSSSPHLEQSSGTEMLFAALGATEVAPTICAATAGAAWASVFGSMASAEPTQVVDSHLVVVWGANPTVSNTHFPPLVQQAVDRGARVVVVDPRRTAMAQRAHLHLAVRPGTDVALALALARYWHDQGRIDDGFLARHADGVDEFLAVAQEWTLDRAAEVCGLAAADIATLADWWADTRPAMLRIGWGQERSANGGAACRAVLALPVLLGQFGTPGSGVIGSTRVPGVHLDRRWPQFDATERRSVNLHEVGRWLAPGSDDPCQVLVVQGANPVVMCPDQTAVIAAFSRDDVFTVVHEQVLTDTTRYADVVLPATTAFEIDDVMTSYGTHAVQPVRAVIDRVGESRSNDEFGLDLADRLGMAWAADVPTGAAARAAVIDDAGPRQVEVACTQFVDTLPFDGRARLVDPVHGAPCYVASDSSFPLSLITPATSRLVNSMFGEFQSPEPAVLLHPADAAARGLTVGDDVVVANELGEVRARLEVGDATRPGVVVMAKGIWLGRHADGRGVNVLTPATSDLLADGACFNDARVEVRRA